MHRDLCLSSSFARATKSLLLAQLIGYRVEAGHRHHTQIRTISVVKELAWLKWQGEAATTEQSGIIEGSSFKKRKRAIICGETR